MPPAQLQQMAQMVAQMPPEQLAQMGAMGMPGQATKKNFLFLSLSLLKSNISLAGCIIPP